MNDNDPTLARSGAGEQPAGDQSSQPRERGGQDQVQSLLRRLKKQEKELAQYRKADEDRQQAGLSEVERMRRELEAERETTKSLKDEQRRIMIRHRFEQEAAKERAVDVQAAYKLADLAGVDLDESGAVLGVEDAISALKKSHEFLFQAPLPPRGVGNSGSNPATTPGSSALTPERITQMSSEEFRAYHQQHVGRF